MKKQGGEKMGPIRPEFKNTYNKRNLGIGILGIFPFIMGLLSLGRSFSPNAVLISELRIAGVVAIGVGILIMVLGYLEK